MLCAFLQLFAETTPAAWERLGELPPKHQQIREFMEFGPYLFADTEIGLARSRDAGKTWIPADTGLFADSLERDLACLGSLGIHLYACTEAGLFRSADSGRTWGPVPVAAGFREPSAFFAEGTDLYATSVSWGRFRSRDAGATWVPLRVDTGFVLLNRFAAHGGYVFAATQFHGVYRSGDRGETWQPGPPQLRSEAITSLAAIPGRLFAGRVGGSIVRTLDMGNTWDTLASVRAQQIGARGLRVFAAWKTEVRYSGDGGDTWAPVVDGLPQSGDDAWCNALYAGADYVYLDLWKDGMWRRPLSEFPVAIRPRALQRSAAAKPNPKPYPRATFRAYDGRWFDALGIRE